MRIVSFNVNGLRAFARHIAPASLNDYALAVLRADILCVQETRGSAASLAAFHSLRDYQTFSSFHPEPGRHGVSTLVRKSLFCSGAAEVERGRVLKTFHGTFTLYNCYLPFLSPGAADGGRVRAVYDALRADLPGEAVVLCGDLNACYSILDHYQYAGEARRLARAGAPPIDSFSTALAPDCATPDCAASGRVERPRPGPRELPYIFLSIGALQEHFFSVYQREWLLRLAAQYLDTFRLFDSGLEAYTCWNTLLNNRPPNLGTRIDYVFCSRDVECTGAGIMCDVTGSDHCPVFADLRLVPRGAQAENLALRHNNLLGFLRKQ